MTAVPPPLHSDGAEPNVADWPHDLLAVADLPCITLAELVDRAAAAKRQHGGWQRPARR